MQQISRICIEYEIDIRGVHIPGKYNDRSDAESRGAGGEDESDFMVMRYVFDRISTLEGAFTVDAASDRDGRVAQPGVASFFSPSRNFLTHYGEAAGQRIWCCPPRRAVGLFLQALEQTWVLDARTTCVAIVPALPFLAWYRRALRRRNVVWRVLDTFPASEPVAWKGELERRRRYPQRPAMPASTRGMATMAIAFP
jgi:hypothetical protein